MSAEQSMEENDWDKAEIFQRAIFGELIKTAVLESRPGIPYSAAMAAAFEEVFRRIDFENHTVTPSPGRIELLQTDFKIAQVAIDFGNFLAWKGFRLTDDFFNPITDNRRG
jgi:hypothetical protein